MDIGRGIRFADELKQDAVALVVEHGYAVSVVSLDPHQVIVNLEGPMFEITPVGK